MNYSREQLKEAFDKVCDKTDWKRPIDSVCRSQDVPIVADAIQYFTATEAHFDYLGVVNGNHMLKVRADGYRRGPAGDH